MIHEVPGPRPGAETNANSLAPPNVKFDIQQPALLDPFRGTLLKQPPTSHDGRRGEAAGFDLPLGMRSQRHHLFPSTSQKEVYYIKLSEARWCSASEQDKGIK